MVWGFGFGFNRRNNANQVMTTANTNQRTSTNQSSQQESILCRQESSSDLLSSPSSISISQTYTSNQLHLPLRETTNTSNQRISSSCSNEGPQRKVVRLGFHPRHQAWTSPSPSSSYFSYTSYSHSSPPSPSSSSTRLHPPVYQRISHDFNEWYQALRINSSLIDLETPEKDRSLKEWIREQPISIRGLAKVDRVVLKIAG